MSLVRRQKIAGLLKQEISLVLYRRINDPRLRNITITSLEVRPDMKTALVKYCRMMQNTAEEYDTEAILEIEKAMTSAESFIFEHLRKALHLRHIPRLLYRYDRSFEGSSRVWSIFSKMDQEKKKLKTGEATS